MKSKLQTIYLKDYRPPSYLVETVDLHIELSPSQTQVSATVQFKANPDYSEKGADLCLHGRQLELLSIKLDGRELTAGEYRVDSEGLTIPVVPERFVLETLVEINPEDNTALEGLYRASEIFCTQCEAQGFRKITFYPDRPDVMARFTTTLVGDLETTPVLLANGNLIESGHLDDGRHYARFEDPFPKPSYLFAMVAGKLTAIDDSFVTMSGRKVSLQIFVEERNRYKCEHAMLSLKNAMRWDEEVFGLEYDLDEYKVVAVDDFNMGAMENKGLNVFNSKYVLAKAETATDVDFQGIEGVIGHEYFHNWTGNRVTCRDWFQLSLKEGLTVFRDQEFSADMGSRAVKRIGEVRLLRNFQFPEDAGPMSHPVRPESYIEINNFYTSTVYNKGAEVIRMYQALLGKEGFQRGMKLYFARHDGQAVTTDDFLAAMADATGADLNQFKRWYSQAGTPVLDIEGRYDDEARTFCLTVRQSCPDTPEQSAKQPFLIPLRVGLLGADGQDLPLQIVDEETAQVGSRTLKLTEAEQTFTFVNLPEKPVPSLLRDFSAPVKVHYPYNRKDLAFLFANDSDAFNRWEAGQRLATDLILEMVVEIRAKRTAEVPGDFLAAFRAALQDREADPALLSLALTLPGEMELAEAMGVADPGAIYAARQSLRKTLALELQGEFVEVLGAMQDDGLYSLNSQAIGRRSLKNLCLGYLALLDNPSLQQSCFDRFADADNMTDRMAALTCLVHNRLPRWQEALAAFYHQFESDPLVVDKWFTLQATSPQSETLAEIETLMAHPAFTIRNPNRVRSLVGAFAQGNPVRFHDLSGAGYAFLADRVIELDTLNPQVAARLVSPLSRWRRYDSERQRMMKDQLERIQRQENLSSDVGEIVGKSL
ncbi:MAG: aminopeptidase N [Deltaproteobacteria bacterium]|nr:MAG: aminopeptidase N [Deltaproteobacteria bacterium]